MLLHFSGSDRLSHRGVFLPLWLYFIIHLSVAWIKGMVERIEACSGLIYGLWVRR